MLNNILLLQKASRTMQHTSGTSTCVDILTENQQITYLRVMAILCTKANPMVRYSYSNNL